MEKTRLSTFQLFCLITATIIGPIQLQSPQLLAKHFGLAGIYVNIFYSLLLLVPIYFIAKLGQLFPNLTFLQYTQKIFETKKYRWLNQLLTWIFWTIFLFDLLLVTGVLLRTFIEPITDLFLYTTPTSFLVFLTIGSFLFCATYRLNVITRLNQLIIFVIGLFILFLFTVMFLRGDIEFLLPWKNYLTNFNINKMLVPHTGFFGLEILLSFMAFYKKPKYLPKAGCYILIAGALFNTVAYITTLSVFGLEELTTITYPLLDIFEESWFFVSLMLFVYFFSCFTSIINLTWTLKTLVKERFKLTNSLWPTIFFFPILYCIVIYPVKWVALYDYYKLAASYSSLVIFSFPILLFFIAKLRKKGGQQA
jgi:spore germination protein